jgi:hypothetical protein
MREATKPPGVCVSLNKGGGGDVDCVVSVARIRARVDA